MYKIVKKIASVIFIFCFVLSLTSCSPSDTSDFSITFIDVGQGDAALVSCDGHYMLVDGGPIGAGEKVYNTLFDYNVTHLDILVISHMHEDHIGGLGEALTYPTTIGSVLSITDENDSNNFDELSSELSIAEAYNITVPQENDKYKLGNAEIEIVAVGDPAVNNDSLVILVTYGKHKFLFTGDMEFNMEKKLCEKYNDNFPITLLKVSHHGSDGKDEHTTITSIRFLRMLNPKYAVISVGENNRYGHPSEQTLSRLKQANVKTYRTDYNGTIVVTSDGSTIKIKTEY